MKLHLTTSKGSHVISLENPEEAREEIVHIFKEDTEWRELEIYAELEIIKNVLEKKFVKREFIEHLFYQFCAKRIALLQDE